jgi:hypothetical protein
MPYTEFSFHQPALDGWSVGHCVFGCASAGIYILITKLVGDSLGYFSPSGWLLLSLMISPFIFITWELLEHYVLKKHVYIAIMGEVKWRESVANSVLDVVLGLACFYGVYAMYYWWFVNDILAIVLIVMFSHALIPFAYKFAKLTTPPMV